MFAGNGDSAKWMKEILRFAREPGQLPTSRRRYEERMAIPRFGNRTSSQLAGASHSVNDQNSRWFSDRGTRVANLSVPVRNDVVEIGIMNCLYLPRRKSHVRL